MFHKKKVLLVYNISFVLRDVMSFCGISGYATSEFDLPRSLEPNYPSTTKKKDWS